jgi:hypothetical protein
VLCQFAHGLGYARYWLVPAALWMIRACPLRGQGNGRMVVRVQAARRDRTRRLRRARDLGQVASWGQAATWGLVGLRQRAESLRQAGGLEQAEALGQEDGLEQAEVSGRAESLR